MNPISNLPPGFVHAAAVPAGDPPPEQTAARAPAATVGIAQRLARPPARPATAERQEEAGRTVFRWYRAHVARTTQSAMVGSGEIWQNVEADLRNNQMLANNEPLSIARLSSINMAALRARLVSNGGPLNHTESAFVDRFLQQQFWATHFTSATPHLPSATPHIRSEDGESVSLLSGVRLKELGGTYELGNTTDLDISDKSDHDHVFFALECGNVPQKPTSRFGSGVYRVPFERLAASSPGVWGALDDLLKGGESVNVGETFPDLTPREVCDVRGYIGPEAPRDSQRADSYADVFTCEHLLAATALNLVNKFRNIQNGIGGADNDDSSDSDSEPHAAQAQAHDAPASLHPMIQSCLASSTSDEFNTLLHTFHRVEIRVPRRFASTDFVHFDATMLGWLKEPNRASAEPDQERLGALVTFCSGSPANVERKLGMLREAGIDVNEIRSNQSGSLLHLLCANAAHSSAKHKQEVRSLIPALLAFGLDVNHPDASGASVVEYARRDADLLRVLLENGANLPSQGDPPGAELSGSRQRQAS